MAATWSMLTWRTITDGQQIAQEGPPAHASRRTPSRGCVAGARPNQDGDCEPARRVAADSVRRARRTSAGDAGDGAAAWQALRQWPEPLAQPAERLRSGRGLSAAGEGDQEHSDAGRRVSST